MPNHCATALSIATSTPVTEASRYIQCALYYHSVLKINCVKMIYLSVCGRTLRSLRMRGGTGEVLALQWWVEVAGHQFP